MNEIFKCARMSLRLTELIGARVEELIDEYGNKEKCICIPIERNGIKLTEKNNVFLEAYVDKLRYTNPYGWTHYIKPKLSPDAYKRAKELGLNTPLIGYLRPSYSRFGNNNYESNANKRVNIEDI